MPGVLIYLFVVCLCFSCMVGVVIGWFWCRHREDIGQYEPDVDFKSLREAFRP